jgi:hypothetical protein
VLSMPMVFVFEDHYTRLTTHVPIDHPFWGPSGRNKWPLIRLSAKRRRTGALPPSPDDY